MFIYLKRVDISMVAMCYASDITEYDERTPDMSNAPLHMKQDANNIEQKIDPSTLYRYIERM